MPGLEWLDYAMVVTVFLPDTVDDIRWDSATLTDQSDGECIEDLSSEPYGCRQIDELGKCGIMGTVQGHVNNVVRPPFVDGSVTVSGSGASNQEVDRNGDFTVDGEAWADCGFCSMLKVTAGEGSLLWRFCCDRCRP